MFVCLGFGHFILFVYFFLGREAQKVCEWGVKSLKISIFPLPILLRGCRSLLEIVFCRTVWGVFLSWIWSFYFICLFFFLGREDQKVREWGVNSLKTSSFQLPTPLRVCTSLLEIVFCRTVWGVCLSSIWSFYFICLFFSLAAKLKRSANGASIL